MPNLNAICPYILKLYNIIRVALAVCGLVCMGVVVIFVMQQRQFEQTLVPPT